MDTKTLLKDASTLQKPRILCLHGGGSNARIFRKQCRILERWLQSSFRLCYAEAPFSSQAGSDVLSVYETYGPFKAWLRWNQDDQYIDSESVIQRIRNALVSTMKEDDLKGATGEWVGLLGFSQGAKISASILLAQQQGSALFQGYWPQPVFKFGVLLAGSAPLVSLMPERPLIMGLADASALSIGPPSWRSSFPFSSVLTIPTIHVHGLRDPGLERHRRLLQDYCDLDRVSLFEWDGDHRVPVKTKDVSVVVEKILTLAGSLRVLDSVDASFLGSEKLVSSSVVMSYWSVK